MKRYAAIDIGTNSVLLLVAEQTEAGGFKAVQERAEITRLGRGVDASKTLSAEGMKVTVDAVTAFVNEARALKVADIAITATSAARDASNGKTFLELVLKSTGLAVDIISGDDEARLSFLSAFADFGATKPLVVIDIGGGSTEFIFGNPDGSIAFKKSFDVGSVRLTERLLRSDPPTDAELAAARAHLKQLFAELSQSSGTHTMIGIAGTVTTLLSIAERMEPYDPARVHGATLTAARITELTQQLTRQTTEQRKQLPGLQPKRADVIAAGALVLDEAMCALKQSSLIVSDRGLRWGLLTDRFGGRS